MSTDVLRPLNYIRNEFRLIRKMCMIRYKERIALIQVIGPRSTSGCVWVLVVVSSIVASGILNITKLASIHSSALKIPKNR